MFSLIKLETVENYHKVTSRLKKPPNILDARVQC